MVVCLWTRGGGADHGRLLGVAPRIAVGAGVIWADARGLDAQALARQLLGVASADTAQVSAGIGRTRIAAEVAARAADPHTISVAPADEAAFLAPFPLAVLSVPEPLSLLLHGIGVQSCAQLAALEREAIEVRFGPDLLPFWRLARAEDERRLFDRMPPQPLHASIDFIDYVISDPERLIFSVNALLATVCEELRAAGRQARRIHLVLALADGQQWERTLRPARPTASRTVWLRLTRAVLERITTTDAVSGIALRVEGTETAVSVQGDLFDAGFASASAVDAALARLIEAQGEVLAQPRTSEHPLPEARTSFIAETPADYLDQQRRRDPDTNGALTLQLLPDPREVLVETVRRRDHVLPIRYRDRNWKQLVTVAGPDRISGGRWDAPFAREYFRAVTVDGVLVWLYRDARSDAWYLHGYWD